MENKRPTHSNQITWVRALALLLLVIMWRISPFDDLIDIFLLGFFILGMLYKNAFLRITKFEVSKVFFFFIVGIFISFSFRAIEIGSFTEQLKKNSEYTSLIIHKIIYGILLFTTLLLFLKKRAVFNKFMKIVILGSGFLTFLTVIGLAEQFTQILGLENYSDAYYQNNFLYEQEIRTFPTMDSNTFGGLTASFFILSIFYYFHTNTKKNKIIFLVLSLIFYIATINTICRVCIIKLFFGMILFIIIYYRFRLKTILLFCGVGIIIFLVIANSVPGKLLFFGINEFIINSIDLIQGKVSIYVPRDSFQFRLLRASKGIPNTFSGWIFGTGGVQSARYVGTSDHIEYSNWLFQYGLITFIPLIFFQFFIIRKFWIFLKVKFKTQLNNYNPRLISAIGISLIVGQMLEMLVSPTFINFWIWQALAIVMINIYVNPIMNLKKRS